MLLDAFIFSLVTFAITMAVSLIVAAVIKAIGNVVRNKEEKPGTNGAKT